MSNFTKEQCQAAKRYCWRMYAHKPWFCGCVYVKDAEGRVVGVEIRKDPSFTDRFTYVTETEDGVPIKMVDWDLDKHGERYVGKGKPNRLFCPQCGVDVTHNESMKLDETQCGSCGWVGKRAECD